MFKKFRPIPWNKFPTAKEVIDETNCLAFVLGLKKIKRSKKQYCLEMTADPIETIFLRKVRKLGFNPKKFRIITQEQEKTTNGYIIRLYGFAPEEVIDEGIHYDFHLIRREPNGTWVHKPGFRYRPRKISKDDWEMIFEKFGKRFVSFAVDT